MRAEMRQPLRRPARDRQHAGAHRAQDFRPLALDLAGVEQRAACLGVFQFDMISLRLGQARTLGRGLGDYSFAAAALGEVRR